jgi:hypothetical protein
MPSTFSKFIRRKLAHCAIPGLVRYVVLFNALVFILHFLAPGFTTVLQLDPSRVLQGQIWRLVTWIFIPETLSPFWIFFALLFLLYVGDGLEAAIGSYKMTLFYLCGVLSCTIVSFGFGLAASTMQLAPANTFLNLSLLLAYATVYPDFQVLVFFVIPLRISWLAIISALLMILSALGAPIVVGATLGAAFLNYLLFFHRELRANLGFSGIAIGKRASSVLLRKVQEESVASLHRCETCGCTEKSNPDLDFRVAANGAEYCRAHLPK